MYPGAVANFASFWSDPSIAVCIHCYRRGTQKVMPPSFYLLLFKSWTAENLLELDNNNAECTDFIHLCQQSSSTLEQALVFLHSTSCSPFSTATATQCSAVPHQWQYHVLTGFNSKDWTGDNLMMQGQDCGVWLHCPSKLVMAFVLCTFVCVVWYCHRGATLYWNTNKSECSSSLKLSHNKNI